MRVDPDSPAGQAIHAALRSGAAVETGVNRLALEPPGPDADEKAFMYCVVKLAKRNGWDTYHTHDSRKSAAGFPDLVMAKPGKVMVAELKVGSNTPTAAQLTWLDLFRGAGIPAYLWRPENWAQIVEVLR